jgi:hypothetical protein
MQERVNNDACVCLILLIYMYFWELLTLLLPASRSGFWRRGDSWGLQSLHPPTGETSPLSSDDCGGYTTCYYLRLQIEELKTLSTFLDRKRIKNYADVSWVERRTTNFFDKIEWPSSLHCDFTVTSLWLHCDFTTKEPVMYDVMQNQNEKFDTSRL